MTNWLSPNPFSAAAEAQALVDTWIDGNRKDVIARLDRLPKKRGLATLFYFTTYLQGQSRQPDYDMGLLGRMLSDRL